jgi:hypothetical protein
MKSAVAFFLALVLAPLTFSGCGSSSKTAKKPKAPPVEQGYLWPQQAIADVSVSFSIAGPVFSKQGISDLIKVLRAEAGNPGAVFPATKLLPDRQGLAAMKARVLAAFDVLQKLRVVDKMIEHVESGPEKVVFMRVRKDLLTEIGEQLVVQKLCQSDLRLLHANSQDIIRWCVKSPGPPAEKPPAT